MAGVAGEPHGEIQGDRGLGTPYPRPHEFRGTPEPTTTRAKTPPPFFLFRIRHHLCQKRARKLRLERHLTPRRPRTSRCRASARKHDHTSPRTCFQARENHCTHYCPIALRHYCAAQPQEARRADAPPRATRQRLAHTSPDEDVGHAADKTTLASTKGRPPTENARQNAARFKILRPAREQSSRRYDSTFFCFLCARVVYQLLLSPFPSLWLFGLPRRPRGFVFRCEPQAHHNWVSKRRGGGKAG